MVKNRLEQNRKIVKKAKKCRQNGEKEAKKDKNVPKLLEQKV